MAKKDKGGEVKAKKSKKAVAESEQAPVKSIADLFGQATVDPALQALFTPNAGRLKPITELPRRIEAVEGVGHVDSDLNNVNSEPAQKTPEPAAAVNEINEIAEPSTNPTKKRKRKEREEESKVDEIESRYMNKVYSKIAKEQELGASGIPSETPLIPHETHEGEDIDPGLLQHETLTSSSDNAEKTIFLSNVPVKVLTSKPLLKQLKQLFSTHGQISSIRFRSIAFSEGGPRKLAFVTKKLHSERDSLNAYIVYQRTESVDSAVRELNGHFWEGKHLRVDSVAHPTPHDHKRSVFVGNLPFDVQDEDLYTHFVRCGAIDFVRVVRDKKTNIGKGFGYVQFKERDAVDKAVLLNDKPSETMNRKVRVTYAKKEEKKAIRGNVDAARVRLERKQKKPGKRDLGKGGKKDGILEGKRAAKDKSGGSGFKVSKKRGKMRLVETRK